MIQPGDAFGLLGVLVPSQRSLFVTALDKSTLLTFSNAQLTHLEQAAPKLTQKFRTELWMQSLPILVNAQQSLMEVLKPS